MEFPDRDPADRSDYGGEVPGADDFSFAGEPAEAEHGPADEHVPDIVAPPDAPGYTEPTEGDASYNPGDATEAGETGEVSDRRTVLDLPRETHRSMAGALELFVSGGQRYADDIAEVDSEGQPEVVPTRGYVREVPRDALVAEGVSYDQVVVSTVEGNDNSPYGVGFVASRVVDREGELPTGPHGEMQRQPVKGLETKTVAFVSLADMQDGQQGELQADAYSQVSTPYFEPGQHVPPAMLASGYEREDGVNEILVEVSVDHDVPLLTAGETEAIMRAVGRALEVPRVEADKPRPDLPSVMTEILQGEDPSAIEIPATGEQYTDLPQTGRAALMAAIDQYARSGESGQTSLGDITHRHGISSHILEEHGIVGNVAAVVIEDEAQTVYRAVLEVEQPLSARGIAPDGTTVPLEGTRMVSFAVYAVTGTKPGLTPEQSPDATGGEGLHVNPSGIDMYRGLDGSTAAVRVSPPPSYSDVRNVLEALRSAIREQGSTE